MSSMKILRNLPPAPKTATKTVRNPNMRGEGRLMFEVKPYIPEWSEEHTRQRAAEARARRMGEAERRHDHVKRLAIDGLSDEEIASRTGYAVDTVRRLVTKLRREGEDIPQRKKGRKCKKQ